MKVRLDYGKTGLICDLPENTTRLDPYFAPGVADERSALLYALRNPIASPPLAELVHPGDTVVIAHTDITRPTPNDRMLPVLLGELEDTGIRPQDITLLNGLGTHRPQTEDELRRMLGSGIYDRYRCIQHNCRDDSQLVSLGTTKLGHPVRVNRRYLEADVRILTGFIEPHCAAGFSGGPKAVLPSLSGAESVVTNHGFDMIGNPKATWGITEGNPIWEEMLEVALRTHPTFLLNVTLNRSRQITGVFAGDLVQAHRLGCAFVRQHAMIRVDAPYDIVITSNSGYPADLNLYQAMKGVSTAFQIIKPGGAIIIAAACEEGIPSPSGYADIVMQCGSPQAILELLSQPGFSYPEQWEAQMQAMIQLHAEVYIYSDGLGDEELRKMLLIPCHSIEQTVADQIQRYGSAARICVLPQGPQVVPYL